MNYPLQQQIEAKYLPEEKKIGHILKCNMCSPSCGFNEALSLCKQSLPKIIELIEKDTREKCAKIVRSHLLTDWSGESEVEAQIEEIACKIELLDNLINKE